MNEESVFYLALERPPSERAAFLEEACAGDFAFRQRVEVLLQAHENPECFLEHPVLESAPLKALVEQLATELQPDQSGHEDLVKNEYVSEVECTLDFLELSDDPAHLGRLDHYQISEVVGRGGMGVVLKAFDETLHRVVALKVMAPELAASAEARQRFVREARAAAAVCHDHVVTIHAVDEWMPPHAPSGTLPYLVMQLIIGESLQQRLDRTGTLQLREILRIGMQTAAGLAAAHAQGLIHRDIKPSNILLENGVERVKITDFGLARAADSVDVTQPGIVAGTPQYMAPEQVRGEPVDHRADLFSLGSVLYAMCTGHPPFRGTTTIAVLRRVSDDTPRPINELNPDIPEWLVSIVDKLLAKNPAERFQSAAEVADLLGGCLAHLQQPSAVPMPEILLSGLVRNGSGVRGHSIRRRRLVAAAVIFMLVGGLGLTEAMGVTEVAEFVGAVLHITTPEGTLVVEVDDPQTRVTIDGEEISIKGAGPQEVRLRPGQYKVRATKDGKPVREELVTITRRGKQVVKVSLEGKMRLPEVPAAKSEPQAFVLSGGAGVAERKYDTLAEAVIDASDGDTIEVHGNGPFVTVPISVKRPQGLTVRAGSAYRPVIRMSTQGLKSETSLLCTNGSLVLEGLDLQLEGPSDQEWPLYKFDIVRSSQAPLYLANCRLIVQAPGSPLVLEQSPQCQLRNCEFLTTKGGLLNWSVPASGGRLVMDNCVQAGSQNGFLAFGPSVEIPRGISIEATRNTRFADHGLFLLGLSWPSDLGALNEAAKSIHIETAANIFDVGTFLFELHQHSDFSKGSQPLSAAAAQRLLSRLVDWQGRRNLYSVRGSYLTLGVDQERLKPTTPIEKLDDWKKFCGDSDSESIEGQIRYQGGNLAAKLAAAPEQLTPEDFRLRPDSAGYRAGKDGKDLGADVDLVGPGAAYERWKKTPEYQQWLKETGQMKK